MHSVSIEKFGDYSLPLLRRATSVALISAYPVLHVLAVWLGLYFSSGSQTATLWTSNALLLAVMVILERRWWPFLIISLVAAEAFTIVFITTHLSLKTAMFFSAANMSEAIFAAYIWQKMVPGRIDMSRLRDCIVLVSVVATTAPALGGLLAGVGYGEAGGTQSFFRFWQLWWAANALGILVVSTTILAWVGISRASLDLLRFRRTELAALVSIGLALAVSIFALPPPGGVSTILGLPSIIYPLLIWGAVRFGTAVSVTLVLLVAIISVIGTDSGNGPFVVPTYSVYESVLSLQVYLATAATMALILGAAFSERRVALRILRESEDKFSKAFHASPDAMCICTITDGKVIDVNRSFCDVIGYARDEAIGSTLADLKMGPLDEYRCRLVDEAETGVESRRISVPLAIQDGTTKECEVNFETIEINGQRSMISVVHDLTAIRAEESKRRALESQLMQSRKMEAIGQLTGGIAHDFNNILVGILGNADMAAIHLKESRDQVLTEYLEGIRDGGMRAKDLVSQLLTFGRKKQGDAKPVRLDAVVEDLIRLLRQLLPSTLRLDVAARAGDATVMADPVQLQQLLVNLCINARDATEGSGTVEIVTDIDRDLVGVCSSCQESFDGSFARLSVCDSGPGIDETELARIFEPFYTSKESGGGSGLGLAVVHGVVHGHNGHIIADSAPGKTVISTYIPLHDGVPVEDIARAESEDRLSRSASLTGRVLLVEDEVMVRDVMAKVLESQGLDVVSAASGADALSLFQDDPGNFDLVISDQTMPGMTGVTLASKLLAMREDLPVILCSGFSRDIDERRALAMGIRGYYQKPVDFAMLRRQVADLLSSK